MKRWVCIHGHFYQPAREDPWLGIVERQPSAAPYHDWNERITRECYGPNTEARILDEDGKVARIVNNYSMISFDMGPTLLSWLESSQPEVYERVIRADIDSGEIFSGHGSAMAHCYNHMIMPLASRRDRETQVIWGIRDFEYRYHRKPEGMWLPETAVDTETLETMAANRIKFVILAPRQARRVRRLGENDWIDVDAASLDTRRPYLLELPSGRGMSVFFYDDDISRGVSFGRLLESGDRFYDRLRGAFDPDSDEPRIVNIATDGETFGHHKKFGEMALAYCLERISRETELELTVYGEFLERHPPQWEVEIREGTSWSCSHGVERWRSDCGCTAGGHPEWRQHWRKPLREALDWLSRELANVFEGELSRHPNDPWAVRNDYISVVLDRKQSNVRAFLERYFPGVPEGSEGSVGSERSRLLKLLEMQRHAMLMYTSCGWFFDEVSRVEGVQILGHAARAAELSRETTGRDLSKSLISLLERVPCNDEEFGNGADLYRKKVEFSSQQ